jgi:hypothetical protein
VNLKRLSAGLDFRGKVEGLRQTYYVFEGEAFFFICSFSRTKPKAGNFNIVQLDAVRYVERLVASRRSVTAQDLYKRSRSPRHVGSSLEALNILYVLVALDRAKIDRRHTGKQLVFNVSKRPKGTARSLVSL